MELEIRRNKASRLEKFLSMVVFQFLRICEKDRVDWPNLNVRGRVQMHADYVSPNDDIEKFCLSFLAFTMQERKDDSQKS